MFKNETKVESNLTLYEFNNYTVFHLFVRLFGPKLISLSSHRIYNVSRIFFQRRKDNEKKNTEEGTDVSNNFHKYLAKVSPEPAGVSRRNIGNKMSVLSARDEARRESVGDKIRERADKIRSDI